MQGAGNEASSAVEVTGVCVLDCVPGILQSTDSRGTEGAPEGTDAPQGSSSGSARPKTAPPKPPAAPAAHSQKPPEAPRKHPSVKPPAPPPYPQSSHPPERQHPNRSKKRPLRRLLQSDLQGFHRHQRTIQKDSEETPKEPVAVRSPEGIPKTGFDFLDNW
ncbi:hypothetical protein MTO96_034190 [Rhipicephalus appendiculatus]